MTATVRCYTHEGTVAMPQSSSSGSLITNGQWMLKQPYLTKEVLTTNDSAAVSSVAATLAPTTNNNIKMLYVQVQPGKRVHYEITPYGHDARTATTESPVLINDVVLVFAPGWAISVLEAATDA